MLGAGGGLRGGGQERTQLGGDSLSDTQTCHMSHRRMVCVSFTGFPCKLSFGNPGLALTLSRAQEGSGEAWYTHSCLPRESCPVV